MSDYYTNADQNGCMDIYDWDLWETGGVDGLDSDWAYVLASIASVDARVADLTPLQRQAEPELPHPETRSLELMLAPYLEKPCAIIAPPLLANSFDFDDAVPSSSASQLECSHKLLVPMQADANLLDECDEQTVTTKPEPSGPQKRTWVCTHLGCNRKKPFSRKTDLKRHVASRHQPSKAHVCPAFGCYKGPHAPAFRRFDKLIDHMRRVHNEHTLYRCCDEDCGAEPMSLPLAAVHWLRAHRRRQTCRSSDATFNVLLWMLERSVYRCPSSGCSKTFSNAYWLQYHLSTHELPAHVRQIDPAILVDLATMHVLLEKVGCHHGTDSALVKGSITCECPLTTVWDRCPICGFLCDTPGIPGHVMDKHPPSDSASLTELKAHREELVRLRSCFAEWSGFASIWDDVAQVVPRKPQPVIEIPSSL